MPDDYVTARFCDTQHQTLNSRIDRIDNRLDWILFFIIITAVGMVTSIIINSMDKPIAVQSAQAAQTPQAQAKPQ